MSLIPDRGSGGSQPAPEGTHMCICIGVIDLGTQPSQWGPRRQVAISFELIDLGLSESRPFVISRVFTNSLHEKSSLRAILESWIGSQAIAREDFSLAEIVGKPAMITVIHRHRLNRTFSEIATVSAVPQGVTRSFTHRSRLITFDIDTDSIDKLEGMPRWLIERATGTTTTPSAPLEDLPF